MSSNTIKFLSLPRKHKVDSCMKMNNLKNESVTGNRTTNIVLIISILFVITNTIIHVTFESVKIVNFNYLIFALLYDTFIEIYVPNYIYHLFFFIYILLNLWLLFICLKIFRKNSNENRKIICWTFLFIIILTLIPFIDLSKLFTK